MGIFIYGGWDCNGVVTDLAHRTAGGIILHNLHQLSIHKEKSPLLYIHL